MQLMPVLEISAETPLLQTAKATESELFLSLLAALTQQVTVVESGTFCEQPEVTYEPIVLETPEEEPKELLNLAAALLSMLASPVQVLPESPEQPELTFEATETIASVSLNPKLPVGPSQGVTLDPEIVSEFITSLGESPIQLPEGFVQELEKLVLATQSLEPRQNFELAHFPQADIVPIPQEPLRVNTQTAASILNSFFQTTEPGEEKPILFALFPEQRVVQKLEQPQELLITPQGETAPKPPLYFLPVVQAEASRESFWEIAPHSLVQLAEAPEEKPTSKGQTEQQPAGGFVLTPKSQEPQAIKLEAPPGLKAPFSFEETMARATVRVGEKIQEIAVKIQPQSLGKVLMRVAVEEGQLVAKFLTESNQAKGILELNLPQLRESLAKEGLVLERCEVAMAWSQEFGSKERQEQRRHHRPRQAVHYEEHLTENTGPQQVGQVNFLA